MSEENKEINKLILGDNLEIMREMNSESIDLIYLDPPFFSNRNYEVIWGDEGEVRSFKDRWSGGIDHYIAWLKERVAEMHRLLKPTGSIFLHCDWHANAYIRVYILDKIFGENNFINEIAWHYVMGASARSSFGKKYDTIFWYSKTQKYLFNLDDVKVPYNPETIARSKRGKARYKKELEENDRKNPGNVWSDINPIQGNGVEKIGYPTQKPEALLERVIKCASNEGNVILDPFVGGGTTIAVADKLNRRWIGIDQSVQAVKVTEFRLNRQQGMHDEPFTVHLHKYDYDILKNKPPFEFESWIIAQFGGTSNTKQRSDKGIDGKTATGEPIQVKRSEDIGVNVIKNFFVSAKQFDKTLFEKNMKSANPVGYIIAFSFGKGAVQEVARLKNEENTIIKLVKVEDIVEIANRPNFTVSTKELDRDSQNNWKMEFTVKPISIADVEFYSWDFNYDGESGFKPAVIRDTEGLQVASFSAGMYNIAVKAVDNNGLENIVIIKLKVNGCAEYNII